MIKKNELDKWSEVHDDAVIIEAFLDFLNSKGISLAKFDGDYGTLIITHSLSRQELIYEHFGIDGQKLEQERRKLLEDISS